MKPFSARRRSACRELRVREYFDAFATEDIFDDRRGVGVALVQDVRAALNERDRTPKRTKNCAELTATAPPPSTMSEFGAWSVSAPCRW
jgi:hypothetical protein